MLSTITLEEIFLAAMFCVPVMSPLHCNLLSCDNISIILSSYLVLSIKSTLYPLSGLPIPILGKWELQSHGIRIELYAVQAQPVVGAVRGIFPNSQQAVIGQRDGAPIHGCVIPAASGLQVGGDNTELVEGNAIPGLAPAGGTFQAYGTLQEKLYLWGGEDTGVQAGHDVVVAKSVNPN